MTSKTQTEIEQEMEEARARASELEIGRVEGGPEIMVGGEPVETTETVPDAVLVIRNVDNDGTITVEVQPVGGLLATEVPTVLKLAVKRFEQQIGV